MAVNPVVADLLRIRMLHSRQFYLNHSIFYHPGQENCITYDTSHIFHLYDTSLRVHVSTTYPQPHSPWKISLPMLDLIS